jgi:type I restriction enzyme S subunit
MTNAEPWVLPDHWAWADAGEVATVVGGGTPPSTDPDNFEGGTIPWITPADLSGYKAKYIRHGSRSLTAKGFERSAARLLPEGAVLFSSRAPIGYVAIAGQSVATNQGFKSFALSDGIDPEYMFYYLQRARDLAVSLASGTTFLELSGSRAARLPVAVAPQGEQHRIVSAIESYFTRLDDAITNLERVERNLKRYRASVLKAAVEGRLVTTEAEVARAEGREYEPASVLLDRILEERRLNWERAGGRGKIYRDPAVPDTSQLPELPQGWCWSTVQQLSTKVVDGVHKKPSYVETGIPFVTVKNLTAGPGISFDDLKYISPEDHKEFVRRANPEEGDILISKDGTLGVVRAVRTRRDFSIFVSVAMVKPALRSMTAYLEVALSAPQVQRQMVPKGSGLQHIHLEDLREDCVPLAPLAEQLRIVIEVQRQLSIAEGLVGLAQASTVRCQRLRQSILRWAFGGRLADQDPSDEPASVLLGRIRHEKAAAGAVAPRERRGRRSS